MAGAAVAGVGSTSASRTVLTAAVPALSARAPSPMTMAPAAVPPSRMKKRRRVTDARAAVLVEESPGVIGAGAGAEAYTQSCSLLEVARSTMMPPKTPAREGSAHSADDPARVATASTETTPTAASSTDPHGGRRNCSTPTTMARISTRMPRTTNRATLSPVPNSEMTRSFSQVGTRSTTAAPTANRGLLPGVAMNAATASAMASVTIAARTPRIAAQRVMRLRSIAVMLAPETVNSVHPGRAGGKVGETAIDEV